MSNLMEGMSINMDSLTEDMNEFFKAPPTPVKLRSKTPLDVLSKGLGVLSPLSGSIGGLIGGGYSSGVGNFLQNSAVTGALSMIPGVGTIASAAAPIVGGGINALFGDKVNQENLKKHNENMAYLKDTKFNAGTFDDVQGVQGLSSAGKIYSGGVFNSSAKRKQRKAEEEFKAGLDYAQRYHDMNVHNIADTQFNDAARSYIGAFGGPLEFGFSPIFGAIDYELAQRRLAQKEFESRKAFGGPLHSKGNDWSDDITLIENGGSHEENPLGGVPMGIAEDGTPNLVQEGEVKYKDYIFSNILEVPEETKKKYKLKSSVKTFADWAKKVQKEYEDTPNDPISKNGLEDIMVSMIMEQEAERENLAVNNIFKQGGQINIKPSKRGTFTAAAKKHGKSVQAFASQVLAHPENYSPAMRKKAQFAKNASKWHAFGGPSGHIFNGLVEESQFLFPFSTAEKRAEMLKRVVPQYPFDLYASYTPNVSLERPKENESKPHKSTTPLKVDKTANLRYVPALGSAFAVLGDALGWTNTPDFSGVNSIINSANSIKDVVAPKLGDYIRRPIFDRLFYANQLSAKDNATQRNILNTSGGNRGTAMAGLLSAGANAITGLGDMFRKAEEFNFDTGLKTAEFNRATNEFNAKSDLEAQMANNANSRYKLSAIASAAKLREDILSRVSAAKSANLSNLFNSIGDIGREAYSRNMITTATNNKFWIDKFGGLHYKG